MTTLSSWEVDAKRGLAPQLRPFLALARLARGIAEQALELRTAATLDRSASAQVRILAQALDLLRSSQQTRTRGPAANRLRGPLLLDGHQQHVRRRDTLIERAY